MGFLTLERPQHGAGGAWALGRLEKQVSASLPPHGAPSTAMARQALTTIVTIASKQGNLRPLYFSFLRYEGGLNPWSLH